MINSAEQKLSGKTAVTNLAEEASEMLTEEEIAYG